MKAVKSEKLAEIINDPENRNRFRKFMVTRCSSNGRFITSKGITTAEFIVGKPSHRQKISGQCILSGISDA